MAIVGPRKKRTRQHVIADLSVHHVEDFILEEGRTFQRLGSDYGYDLIMNTFDDAGYAEPWLVYFQMKAAESLRQVEGAFVFDMDVRDYHLWTREEVPVILILFDVTRRTAFWVCVQSSLRDNSIRSPKKGAKTVRVRVSARSVFNRSAVKTISELKSQFRRPDLGVLK